VDLNFKAMFSIRIRVGLALQDLDPDPYCECGSGSRSKEFTKKFTNKPDFQPFKKAFLAT
jgi:hypothetical protein